MESHEVWRGSWWWSAHATAKVRCTTRFLPMETMISSGNAAGKLIFVADLATSTLLEKRWGHDSSQHLWHSCFMCLVLRLPPPAGNLPAEPAQMDWLVGPAKNWWDGFWHVFLLKKWWANLNSATDIYRYTYIYINLFRDRFCLKMWRCAVFFLGGLHLKFANYISKVRYSSDLKLMMCQLKPQ